MIISQANAFGVERIKVWRLEDRIPMTGKIAVALIICDNQNNIGGFRKRDTVNDVEAQPDQDNPKCSHVMAENTL